MWTNILEGKKKESKEKVPTEELFNRYPEERNMEFDEDIVEHANIKKENNKKRKQTQD